MAVRRDPRSGQWRYRKVVRLPDGRRERVSGTPTINTKVEAERAEREHLTRVLNPIGERKEVLTFQQFVDERWWPKYPNGAGNRPTTVREKEIHLRLHLKPALGPVLLPDLRGEIVVGLFAGLVDKGLNAKSRKNVRATLRRILASAAEWGYLDSVPPLPKIKVPDPSWDFLISEESDRLIEAARDDEQTAILMFALRTGARAGEQLAFEWGDIDWHNRFVVFRRSSTRGIVGPTKSGKERKVPMTASLIRALRAVRHLRGPLVFSNPDGRPLSLWQLHERLWTACRRAGLRKIRWHDLRHTFASQLVMAGVPLKQVQEWLGHSTLAMTMRYAHLAPGDGGALIAALDGRTVATTWQRQGGGSEKAEENH